MRRFLALGCQEPSLLCCPAEAASPPPLSAFQRSPNNYSVGATTLIPSPNPLSAATTAVDRLFTNIDRQLSAKIAFIDPLLLTASGGGGGGGGGNGDSNDQQVDLTFLPYEILSHLGWGYNSEGHSLIERPSLVHKR